MVMLLKMKKSYADSSMIQNQLRNSQFFIFLVINPDAISIGFKNNEHFSIQMI
jgi:hypothetical protein